MPLSRVSGKMSTHCHPSISLFSNPAFWPIMCNMNSITFLAKKMKICKAIPCLLAASLIGVCSVQFAAAATISSQTTRSTVVGAKTGMIPPTSSVQDLESTLKESYVGTYAIYGSLPDQHKLALYSSVKQGGNIKDFRDQVIRMRLHR